MGSGWVRACGPILPWDQVPKSVSSRDEAFWQAPSLFPGFACGSGTSPPRPARGNASPYPQPQIGRIRYLTGTSIGAIIFNTHCSLPRSRQVRYCVLCSAHSGSRSPKSPMQQVRFTFAGLRAPSTLGFGEKNPLTVGSLTVCATRSGTLRILKLLAPDPRFQLPEGPGSDVCNNAVPQIPRAATEGSTRRKR